ncbi:sigma-70 family RNA polymerase sigma factor [Nonomuraea turcica]|uniref:sigma-70 family RNA polymerase sigma factor n=1 Tax=Nonomuraea sp. G32 TaxID=3067274 RepID=UPI00273C9DA8|nr:sigma-70 family RNA polymerase sigma factor [Nonomuraea sp. G32]MDP4507555.1 sigma-70 family RNA polymerase sigma factor [Nonomuraea sp. G32]
MPHRVPADPGLDASWWRRRWRDEVPTEVMPEGPTGRDFVTAVNARDALWEAIGALPRRQCAALVLRYFDDMTPEQVARVLGCSVGTVKKQLSRALARLRVDPSLRDLDMEVV